tara:strand:- start:225 stop:1058 length:834 start_codon:yes stop_codon:yes gene_type:complete
LGKEKIIVARRYDSSSEGGLEHQGVEVSIGLLTSDKLEQLKLSLQNDSLFEERTYRLNNYLGSDFLTDLLDINEYYHKQGMITYEGELCNDKEEYSTDNWEFSDEHEKATKVVFDWEEDEKWASGNILKIPKKGFSVVSVRSESLYFYAEGDFPIDKKKINQEYSNDAIFNVQPGIDTIWPGSGFCDFDILHSVFVDGKEIGRNFEKEEGDGLLYYSTHLLFKDGIVVAWLATNNNPHFWPFGDEYTETSIPCISPYLKKNFPENFEVAVQNLLKKL